MDSETLSSSVEYLASSGVVLSVETKASIKSSLITLKTEHKFRRIKFWGIIKGIQKDYYIIHGVGKNELTERKSLYSQDCINWHLLPYAEAQRKSKADLLEGRFTGDPSFEYEHTTTQKSRDESDEIVSIEMKEQERLACTVSNIDGEAAVVPRGAYLKTPLGEVVQNKAFQGLPLGDAKRLNYYFHFRAANDEDNKNTMTHSIDFMDPIDKDTPKGCWSLQCDQGGASVVLRSLTWPGMVAYCVPNSTSYGYFYCGTGERNRDLLFML